jgi:hypothetical protein
MATVNKDFRIKSGLIVEGSTATVNGYDVLTKKAADQSYIIGLIGGSATAEATPDTVVLRDENADFAAGTITANIVGNVTGNVAGDLTGDVTGTVSDISNHTTADLAEDINGPLYFTDDRARSAVTSIVAEGITLDNNGPGGATRIIADSSVMATRAYADTAEADANSYTDMAILNLNLGATYDAYGAAATAEQNAKDYADDLINDASSSSTEVWSAYKTSTEIGLAQAAAETHADEAIAALVDGAPGMLDTLNELAAALQDNPDVIQNIQDVAAGKQDTLTAGDGIDIDTVNSVDNTIHIKTGPNAGLQASATGLVIKRSAVDTWYDAAGAAATAEGNANDYTDTAITNLNLSGTYDAYGAASTAESNANSYTDTAINGLDTDDIEEGTLNRYYTDSRAESAVKALLTSPMTNTINLSINENEFGDLVFTAENGVADSDTDDLTEGSTNLYFTNTRVIDAVDNADITPNSVQIDTFRKEVATHQVVASASTVDVHYLPAPYESAKYLVRVVGTVGGTKHSQISEILMTTDGNFNIAITEYGTIHTSESPLATFSAGANGPSLEATLTATTAVADCEIIAAATMLSWDN